jgi:hypothetical protein
MPDYDPRAVEARQAQARADAEAGRLRTAHLTPQAIASCTLCDADGYRGTNVCDHEDHAAAARAGVAACKAALAKGGN